MLLPDFSFLSWLSQGVNFFGKDVPFGLVVLGVFAFITAVMVLARAVFRLLVVLIQYALVVAVVIGVSVLISERIPANFSSYALVLGALAVFIINLRRIFS